MMQSPQHLIPDFVTRTTTTTWPHPNGHGVTINGTLTTIGNLTQTRPTFSGPSGGPVLGIILALSLIALVFIIMFFSRESSQSFSGSFVPNVPGGFRYGDRYIYEGRKMLIRKLYLSFLSFLRMIGLSVPEGYTPREVVMVALKNGIKFASRISDLYYRFIYRPEEPPKDIEREINEIKRNFEVKDSEG